MLNDKISELKIPKPIRGMIINMVHAVKAASTKEKLEREGSMELAFILGLDVAKNMSQADIEVLYAILDEAVQERLAQLGGGRYLTDGITTVTKDICGTVF
ncbi:hypothetical protein PSH58_10870 [Pseudomonas hefeiensis]|uniref:Uncharacterized protein n=1 Tax=Pseudomonas hefeiensis TaxID=2738125 RepID=A0ABY9GGK8_9PSED|nr:MULTISPECIES: hypothetical protein [unclassified Pseudomonas]WLH14768.1 hypothetical protein PSH57_10850 [Pseudomonas sp. FP205]WLH97821.1 hypothetical protein PSH58_10870 [Pseudomonas sp. FP53]WLI42094.1 hypothetical protein PSH74_10835 [Pseudomonas sp. FP821]